MQVGAAAFRIRRAEPRDQDVVIALQDAAFPGERGNLDRGSYLSCLADPMAMLLVAEAGGGAVGCGLARNRPWRPWTSGDFLCISERHRGTGMGTAIIEACEAWGRRPSFRIFVRPTNLRARNLYRRLGFFQTGIRRANYADGEDAIILMKPLFSIRAFWRTNGART